MMDEKEHDCSACIHNVIELHRHIALLERMVYEFVSLRDVMSFGLSEELYNEIVDKFEGDDRETHY